MPYLMASCFSRRTFVSVVLASATPFAGMTLFMGVLSLSATSCKNALQLQSKIGLLFAVPCRMSCCSFTASCFTATVVVFSLFPVSTPHLAEVSLTVQSLRFPRPVCRESPPNHHTCIVLRP